MFCVTRAPFAEITEPPDSRKRVDSVELPGPPLAKLPPPRTPTDAPDGRVTPGERPASSVKFRCGIGKSVTSMPEITSPRTLVSLSTIDAPSFVTLTMLLPTPLTSVNLVSTETRELVSTVTVENSKVLKPSASTCTE